MNYSFLNQVLKDSTETIKNIESNNWNKLYEKVYKANQIYIISTGVTQQVQATEFQRLFMLTGKNVRVIPGNKELAEFRRMSEFMTKDDLVFILSLSGENKDLETVINILKVKKIKLVSMTNYLSNWLSMNCDFNLYCYSFFVLIESFIFGFNDYIKGLKK